MTSSHPRIPPLLSPYLALPPESSLILLTSVLGASTNWLVLRFLCAALADRTAGARRVGGEELADQGGDADGEVRVVLVSFLRDWGFWREGGRRVVSVIFCFVLSLSFCGLGGWERRR